MSAVGKFSQVFLGILILGLTVLLAPWVILSESPNLMGGGYWLVNFAVVILAGFGISWVIYDGRQRWSLLMVCIFYYLFIGLAGMAQMRSGITPTTTLNVDVSAMKAASLLSCFSFLAFLAGYWHKLSNMSDSGSGSPSHLKNKNVKSLSTDWLNVQILCVVSIFIAILVTYFIFSIGASPLFTGRAELNAAVAASWSSPVLGQLMLNIIRVGPITLSAAWAEAQSRFPGRSEEYGILKYFFVSVAICMNNFVSNPRFVAGATLMCGVFLLGWTRSRSAFRLLAGIAVIGFVFVFQVADYFRNPASRKFDIEFGHNLAAHGDYDAFSQAANAISYVTTEGFHHGRQICGVLSLWIPRSVWPTKPTPTGELLAEYKGYAYTNLSAPVFAEFYVDGGYIAIAVGMFVLGGAACWSDVRVCWQSLGVGYPLSTTFIPFNLVILMRGSLMGVAAWLLIHLALVVLIRLRFQPAGPAGANRWCAG